MKRRTLREGQKAIRHVGFAALVKTEVNLAPVGQPPKLVKRFLRVGPCLPNRDSVESYLKEDHIGQIEAYRIVGVRIDATPLIVRQTRTEETPAK